MKLRNMSDSKKQVCRLCLQITPVSECEIIEDIKKEILKILLIGINFDICDDAVACRRCLETIQDCFEFKSQVTSFMELNVKVDVKNVFQKGMMSLEISKICRLCMSVIEDKAFDYATDMKDEAFLNDMIRHCLPGMIYFKLCLNDSLPSLQGLNLVHEVLICKRCVSNTKKYYEFVKNCQKVEQKIENYCKMMSCHRIILNEVFKFKNDMVNKPMVIKKESPDETNVNVVMHSENEHTTIKFEEIHIKDELDKIENDVCSHLDNEMHNVHMTSHNQPSKVFGCSECSYETNRMPLLVQHLPKRKDQSKVEMHMCLLCPFNTKYKRSLDRHQLLHKKPHEIPMHKCEKCQYETKHKDCLASHMLKHEDPLVVKIFNCEKCTYQTKWKRDLKKHEKIHSDEYLYSCNVCSYTTNVKWNLYMHKRIHSDEYVYSCNVCSYSTHVRRNLNMHKRTHQMDMEERQMFKCKLCTYQAKTTANYKNHLAKIHMDPSVLMLKCTHCPYVTSEKQNLSQHMRRQHKDQRTYKCALCLFVTTKKTSLVRHSFIHQKSVVKCPKCDFRTYDKSAWLAHMNRHDPSKQPSFKCDRCKYHTTTKQLLNRHRVKHMELGETTVYSCATCDYKTKYKNCLRQHLKTCLKKKDKKKVKVQSENLLI